MREGGGERGRRREGGGQEARVREGEIARMDDEGRL